MSHRGPLLHVRHAENHMATTFEFVVSCDEARAQLAARILEQAHAVVARLERELSEFLPESPVHRLNHAAPGERIAMTEAGIELLARSKELRARTQGRFNAQIKSDPELVAAGRECIEFDPADRQAWRTDAGARVGFGAIGKGYALDQVRLLLEGHGFQDFVLSGGGSSIILSGFAGPGDPWRWAWSWAKDSTGENLGIPLSHPSGDTVAIGVSGTHEKGRHILFPPGEARASAQPRSALVACASATDADALSTALFVSGWEEGRRLISTPAAMIDAEGVASWNGGFQRRWGTLDRNGSPALPSRSSSLALGAMALFASLLAHFPQAHADEGIDLGALGGGDIFNPYLFERDPKWMLLPILSAALVLLHLKKNRRQNQTMKQTKKPTNLMAVITVLALWAQIERASAAEFEKLGKAIATVIGTTQAAKKGDAYVAKAGGNKNIAFVEKGIYEPNCTHTWVIGLDKASGKVVDIRVIEMSCPHAFPTRAASFMDQFKGKGPVDVAKLDSEIQTVAKATGSAVLLRDAVKRSITAWSKNKGSY